MTGTRLRVALAAVTLLTAAQALLPARAQTIAGARSSARQGRADAAIDEAEKVAAGNPNSAEAFTLLCSLYGSIDRFDDAIRTCEKARSLEPGSSNATLEVARAYGAKADHAGSFTGMRLVGKIRENFEHAVQLDPKNIEALSDLGEFYVDAPGIVGGGVDRAKDVAARLLPLSAARGHRLLGMVATKKGDGAAADAEYQQEIAAAPSPEAYVDLATSERRRKQPEQAAANAKLAIQKDTRHGPDSVDAAKLLIDLKQELPVAIAALKQYLATPQVSSVLPVARVRVLLGQALAASGDSEGAQAQYRAALDVAKGYEPARRALRS